MEHSTHQAASSITTTCNRMSKSSIYLFAILSFITTTLLSESPTLLAQASNGNNGGATSVPQGAAGGWSPLLPRPDPSGRPQLMVAIYCGSSGEKSSSTLYHNQYLEIESKKWRTDRDASAFCTHDKQAILNYCKKVYPDHDIRNIVESSRPYKIDDWCRLGQSTKRKCRARLTTRPYRCLEGTFQSDALLVPERCVFDHVHNKSVCESSDSWNKSASEACHSKGMRLQSFGMLQPCGLDVFSGVEFVCCPAGGVTTLDSDSVTARSKPETSNSELGSNSFAQAANGILSAAKSKYDNEMDQMNNIKTDEDIIKKHHDRSDNQGTEQGEVARESSNDENEDDADDEYDEDEDGYDDDSSSWNNGNDKQSSSSSASSTTSTTTTTTTTTTTERPIERYLSHFDLAHEHDDYRKAELAIESSYRDKVTHVMREWSQLDGRYEEMKKNKDAQAAEEFKRKMTHQFKKTIEALEQESAAQRHQLASMHAERAMAIINRRKKVAMDCLTQALDRIPIRTRQVERCIVRLLKALEKDRTHTLRQYKNLLNLNTREALHERKIILEHLVTLNKAANQSIAMLDRSPVLVDKLKGKIVSLWHKLRNIPLSEPIVKESEEKIMSQYEEEVAQRKIDRERKRLVEQEQRQGQSTDIKMTSSKATTNKEDASDATTRAPPASSTTQETPKPTSGEVVAEISTNGQQQQQQTVEAQSSVLAPTASRLVGGGANNQASAVNDMGDKAAAHYQTDSVGFSHLRLESPYHELSYSTLKHDPLEGHMKFGLLSSTSLLITSLVAFILLAFLGVKYYGKNSSRAYRRQGFAEVGRSCPEERSVTHMQFNGYENPAYKFFEAEA